MYRISLPFPSPQKKLYCSFAGISLRISWALLPDSPEWFDWLATLSSFRFLGQQGRLSTYRNPGRTSWMAYRRIHGRRYDYGLGNTKLLTIAHLEQMAATLQSSVSSLS